MPCKPQEHRHAPLCRVPDHQVLAAPVAIIPFITASVATARQTSGFRRAIPVTTLRSMAQSLRSPNAMTCTARVQPVMTIRILLLGIDGSESARDGIAARLAFMGTIGVDLNLGAWITAAVESGGPDGVAQVERLVLAPPDRLTPPELTQVVRPLSVLSAAGDPALRASLDGAIRRLVSRRPDAGTLIAQAFGATADFSQVELIGELVAARVFTDRHDLMAAAAYASRSSVPAGAGATAARPGQGASLR